MPSERLARSAPLCIRLSTPAGVATLYRLSTLVTCTLRMRPTMFAGSSFVLHRCGTRISTVSPSVKSTSSAAVCWSMRFWFLCTARALSAAARSCRTSYARVSVSCSSLLPSLLPAGICSASALVLPDPLHTRKKVSACCPERLPKCGSRRLHPQEAHRL